MVELNYIICKQCKNRIDLIKYYQVKSYVISTELNPCCQLTYYDYIRRDNMQYAYNQTCNMVGYKI